MSKGSTATATKKRAAPKKKPTKAKPDVAPKKDPKAKAPASAVERSEHETLEEARRLARSIRGKRHEEEGLRSELKEVVDEIKRLTDQQNEVLLDIEHGQNRLPFGDGKADTKKPAKAAEKPKLADVQTTGAIETTLDGKTLRIVPEGEEFAAVLIEGSEPPHRVGEYANLQNAKNALLEEIEWHGNAPEWRPVQVETPAKAPAA